MPEADQEMTEFVRERVFAAPVETVWRAWTEPTLLTRWYKPDPSCATAVLEHDLRPGGVMRYEMCFGGTQSHYERWEFEVIEPPRRLQWKQALTDAEGNLVGNPRMPDWPRWMLATIELEAHDDGTLQRLRWKPHDATEAEIACFRNASAHLDKGWVTGFRNLGELLQENTLTSSVPPTNMAGVSSRDASSMWNVCRCSLGAGLGGDPRSRWSTAAHVFLRRT